MLQKRGKIVLVMAIMAVFLFFVCNQSFSYDTNIAHPNIANLAARLYNQQAKSVLSAQEISWLKQGAIDEDMPTRWLNHFFDPIYNRGYGNGAYASAKQWAKSPDTQVDFSFGDQTWQRAITDYQHGDKESAFKALGHIIHLLSDMTVPAHTRDDGHPLGDSYEQFVKYNWEILSKGLENIKTDFTYFNNLDTYFDNLANYSNNNFYSDDTIKDKKYSIINITQEKIEKNGTGKKQKYSYAQEGENMHRLYITDIDFLWQSEFNRYMYVKDSVLLTDYTKHLFPKAVGYSAGVIKLFFDEIERGVKYDVPKTKISFLGKMNELLGFAINSAAELKDKLFDSGGQDVVKANEQVIQAVMESEKPKIGGSAVFPESDTVKVALKIEPAPEPEQVALPEETIVETSAEQQPEQNPESAKQQVVQPKETSAPKIVYTGGGGGGGGGGGSHSNNEQIPISNSQPLQPDELDAGQADSNNQTPSSTPETPTTTPTIVLPEISVNTATTTINTATTTISGTKNEATISVILNVAGAVSYPSSTAWQAELVLPDGENTIEICGENGTGQHSTTSTIAIIVDTTAPDIPSINVVQSEFATPTLYVSWQSADSGTGIDSYDVEYLKDTAEWTRIFTNTTSTGYVIEAERLKTYQFRARAYDTIGNISEWSSGQQIIPDWPKSVVISEVAWMGTGPTPTQRSDEWLELYNNTGADINVTSWKILVGSTLLNFTNLVNPVIPANGYLLLERTDDNAVYDIPAGIIFTGDIPNNCSGLTLADASGNTIDQIGCNGVNWYAGTTSDYRTMERLSPTAPGGLATNWQASDSVAPKGRPYGGSVIYGSPKLPNAGYWLLKSNLASYYSNLISNNILILTKAQSPYFIDYQTIIPAGLTVKIEPGAVLVGYDRSSFFDVSGELQLNGTAEESIIITSALDNNYFHHPEFSMLSSGQPAGGDWGRIEIKQGGKFSASQAKFLYGGSRFYKSSGWVYGKYMAQAIRNLGGGVDLNNAEFRNFYLETREDEKAYNALVWSESAAGGAATTTIQNSLFSGGYLAVKNNQSNVSSTITGSTFENFSNPTGPIVSQYNFPTFFNNIFLNNSSDMMDLGGWTLNTDATLNPGVNYLFNSIIVPAGITLTVSPGVNLTMKNGDMQINGSLKALGTAEAPINLNPPAGGQWGIMLFSSSSDSALQNVNLNGGNVSSLRPATSRGVLTAENSNLVMDNVNITNSDRPEGMTYFKNSTVDIKNSSLVWTAPWHLGSWLTRGITLNGGTLNLDNVSFNQMDYGIYIISGQIGAMENMGPDNFQNISISNQWPSAF